jgi:hypothetical protein
MKLIIDSLLSLYSYFKEEKVQLPSIDFYKHKNKKIASYFLIYNIDCREIENNEESMKTALELLEKNYSSSRIAASESIISKILNSFDNNQEASQVDKNTSAIYLLQFNDLNNLILYRNLIYAIEESPNYFRRYILPFTEVQTDILKKIINDHADRSLDDILSDIANNEDEYYKLSESKNIGSVYELVIRIFSKLPFLQYKFKADPIPISIETDILQKVKNANIERYHIEAQKNEYTLSDLLNLENNLIIDENQLEIQLKRLLQGGVL